MAFAPLGWVAQAQPIDPAAEELTLEKCIKIAIESSTDVLKSRLDIGVSGAQLLQSYGQFLPNLVLGANAAQNEGRSYITTTTPTHVESIDIGGTFLISSSLNVFNGYADTSSLKSATERKSASELTLERAKQQIALDVSQAFIQTIFDVQLMQIAAENLRVSRLRLDLLQQQSALGSKKIADRYRQEAQTSQDEGLVLTANNRYYADLFSLLKRLRLDPNKQYRVVDPFGKKDIDEKMRQSEDEDVSLALQRRPDLRAGDRLYNAALSDVRASRAGLYPRVDFGVSIFGNGRSFTTHSVNGVDTIPGNQRPLNEQLTDQLIYTVGFTLTWNIFDRYLTKAAMERANMASRRVEIDNEDRRVATNADVRQAYRDCKVAIQQWLTARKGLVAAQKAFEVIKAQFDLGSISFLDLSTAQSALLQAQMTLAQTALSYELKKKALIYFVGSESL